jgi:hypothetical protein
VVNLPEMKNVAFEPDRATRDHREPQDILLISFFDTPVHDLLKKLHVYAKPTPTLETTSEW